MQLAEVPRKSKSTKDSNEETNTAQLNEKSDEKPKKVKVKKVSCCALFRFAHGLDILALVVGLIAAFVAGSSQTLLMFTFGSVMDSLAAGSAATSVGDMMNESLILLIYVALGSGVAYALAYSLVPLVAVRIVHAIRLEFFRAVLRQDMEFFDAKKPGELTGLINANAADIGTGLSNKLVDLVMASSGCVVAIAAAFYYSWEMSLVLLGFLPILGAVAALVFKLAGGDMMEQRKAAYADADAIASETLSAIRTVQSFSGEVAMANRYSSQLGKAEKAATNLNLKVASAGALMMGVMFAMYGGGFWYGGFLIAESRLDALAEFPAPAAFLNASGEFASQGALAAEVCAKYMDDDSAFASCACDIPFPPDVGTLPNCGCQHQALGVLGDNQACVSTGTVLIAFFCLITGGFSLGQLGPALQALAKAQGMAHGLYKVIERASPIDDSGDTLPKDMSRPSLEFRDVHFSYRNNESDEVRKPVFGGLSFKVNSGETVAFVGESGSGKSTLAKLFSRNYDVDSGEVLVNGVNVRQLNVSDLRSRIGYVSQEPLLFNKTLRENIALGLAGQEVSLSEVQEAAKASNAHDFIESAQFPDGYDTVCGVRGGALSGGQKQRVALARGLVRKPAILILDEATSALDMTSERNVQAALEKSAHTRTTIVIAHRLSTVQSADRIIVLGEGDNGLGGGTKIVEQGTHAELMLLEGAYYALVGQQGEGGEVEDEVDVAKEQERRISLEGLEDEQAEVVQTAQDKKDSVAKPYKVSNLRVWRFAHGKYGLVAVGMLCAVLSGAVMPSLGLVFSEMLSAFTNYDDASMRLGLLTWACYFFGIAILQFVVNLGKSYFFAVTGETIVTRIRAALFKAMVRQDISYFDDPANSSGRLLTLLGSDATLVQLVTGQRFGSVLGVIATLTFGLAIAFISAWQLALALLAAMPLLGLAQAITEKVMLTGEVGAMDKLSKCSAVFDETVLSMKEVQAFGLGSTVHGMYSTLLAEPSATSRKSALLQGVAMGISQAVSLGFYAFAFWFGGSLVDNQEITYDGMMKALFVLAFAAGGAGQAAMFAGDQSKAGAACSGIFRLIDRVPSIDTNPWVTDTTTKTETERSPTPSRTIPAEQFQGRLELKNVNFHYPTRADAEVFDNLSLIIEPGQCVAFVGPSGSGKSTIIQLLERFYDPAAASRETSKASEHEVGVTVESASLMGKKSSDQAPTGIELDGVDFTLLDAKWLRSVVGLVGQEPKLFFGSIAENIAMGKPGATKEEVEQAARSANAHDFIMKIGGYDIEVGSGGGKLSGGQKQRIAIARAIIKNPKILLLDEATSALDNESEKIVQASLDQLLAEQGTQRTTIVVAHRLSTIINCDVIFVLEPDWINGRGARVVERGTHEELMRLGGRYTALRRAFDGSNEDE